MLQTADPTIDPCVVRRSCNRSTRLLFRRSHHAPPASHPSCVIVKFAVPIAALGTTAVHGTPSHTPGTGLFELFSLGSNRYSASDIPRKSASGLTVVSVCPCAIVPPDPGLSRSLSAFTVALNLTCEEDQQWYTSTKELQLASRQFCTACREVATLHLRNFQQPMHLHRRRIAAVRHAFHVFEQTA